MILIVPFRDILKRWDLSKIPLTNVNHLLELRSVQIWSTSITWSKGLHAGLDGNRKVKFIMSVFSSRSLFIRKFISAKSHPNFLHNCWASRTDCHPGSEEGSWLPSNILNALRNSEKHSIVNTVESNKPELKMQNVALQDIKYNPPLNNFSSWLTFTSWGLVKLLAKAEQIATKPGVLLTGSSDGWFYSL